MEVTGAVVQIAYAERNRVQDWHGTWRQQTIDTQPQRRYLKPPVARLVYRLLIGMPSSPATPSSISVLLIMH
jgi:hypothetical protein